MLDIVIGRLKVAGIRSAIVVPLSGGEESFCVAKVWDRQCQGAKTDHAKNTRLSDSRPEGSVHRENLLEVRFENRLDGLVFLLTQDLAFRFAVRGYRDAL